MAGFIWFLAAWIFRKATSSSSCGGQHAYLVVLFGQGVFEVDNAATAGIFPPAPARCTTKCLLLPAHSNSIQNPISLGSCRSAQGVKSLTILYDVQLNVPQVGSHIQAGALHLLPPALQPKQEYCSGTSYIPLFRLLEKKAMLSLVQRLPGHHVSWAALKAKEENGLRRSQTWASAE